MNRKQYITAFFICLLCAVSILPAADALVERYLSAANDRYSEGDYTKAYEYVNRVLDMYRDDTLPENVTVIGEMIYYDYLGVLKENGDEAGFIGFNVWLENFPELSSSRIKIRSAEFESEIARSKNAAATAATAVTTVAPSGNTGTAGSAPVSGSALSDEQWLQQLEAERQRSAEALQMERERSAQVISSLDNQSESLRSVIEQSTLKNESANRNILILVLVISAVLVIVFIVVIISIVSSIKTTRRQQEQFAATLQMVAKMNRIPSERVLLGNVADIYGDAYLRSAGSTRVGDNALPEPELTEADRQAVQELAVKCEQVGTEIDVMTGRKNNSKNISEMVYKIALEMGISQNTVMIYFCASMVYDIGFLSMDKDLLQAETLTDEQKYIIRSHVKIDVSVFDFVPEQYRAVFIDAASMHHENMDGSGYPDGIPGDKIPEIARMIHVVETFISLISRRSYRAIFDKESAIEELKNHPELYDQKIVSVLDCII